MDYVFLALILTGLIFWKIYFSKYKITLVSPVFRNIETKELGCWAYLNLKMPFPPFIGLIIHDGKGGIYRVREIQWDAGDKSIRCQTYHPVDYHESDEVYEHVKKHLIEWGWKIREVPVGHILKEWEKEYEQ